MLSEQIEHHVHEEEKRSNGIFSQAQAAGIDMDELGNRLMARKEAILREYKTSGIPAPETRTFTGHTLEQGEPETKRLFERHALRCRENNFLGGDYRCSRAVAYRPGWRRSAWYHKRCLRCWRFSVRQQLPFHDMYLPARTANLLPAPRPCTHPDALHIPSNRMVLDGFDNAY